MKKLYRGTTTLLLMLMIVQTMAIPAYAAGYRLKEAICGSERIIYTYNRDGTLARESHIAGGEEDEVVEYTYPKDRKMMETTIPVGVVTLFFHYDSNGTQIELENPGLGGDVFLMEGESMSTQRDKNGYVTMITFHSSFEGESDRIFYYTYDDKGRIKTFEISGFRRDTFEYDRSGTYTRTSLLFRENESAVRERYDTKGRLIESQNQYGMISTYTYDENGRLSVEYLDGELEYSYRYDTDVNGNIIRMTKYFSGGGKEVTEYRYEKAG